MNVVLAVTSKVDQFRNRLFLRNVNRAEKVFLHAARLSISEGQSTEKIRVWILVRATGIVEAEMLAETRLQVILQDYKDRSPRTIELKRLKPRELTVGNLSEASEGILHLLRVMRRESGNFVISVDPVEKS